MSKKPLIPFSMTPASWGLKGVSRQVAEAEYLYTGEELERKLAEIHHEGIELKKTLLALDLKYRHIDAYTHDMHLLKIDGVDEDEREILKVGLKHLKIIPYEFDKSMAKLDHPKGRNRDLALLDVERKHDRIDPYDYDLAKARLLYQNESELTRALLDIEHNHRRIDDYDYALKVAELSYDEGTERELAVVEAKFRYGKMDEHQYEKDVATLKETPWVRVIDSGFDPEQGPTGVYFEFDWNDYMILYLRMNGYSGPTEASIIDAWFNDLCRAQGIGTSMGSNDLVPFGRM